MRNACSIRMVAGDGGLNTEAGLGLSMDHSEADPVRAVAEVKDQEITLTAHTHIPDLMLRECGLLPTFLWWLMRCLS